MLKKLVRAFCGPKVLNQLSTLNTFSSSSTEIIPRVDMIFVYLFYRMNVFRNRFLKKSPKPFDEKVSTRSNVVDFQFSEDELKNFEREGITPVFKLKDEVLASILKTLNESPLQVDGNEVKMPIAQISQLASENKLDGLMFYSSLNRCNELIDIGTDPAIIQFVSKYLRSDSFTMDVMAYWSFPNKEPIGNQSDGKYDNAQNFHYDHVSRRCMKIFIYLSDCEMENGPHSYIKKSHLHRPFPLQLKVWSLKDEEMQKYTPKGENWLTITGKAGSAFMTDPFGTHRGLEPVKGFRLLMQFMYTVDRFRPANFEINLNASDILSGNSKNRMQ